MGVKESIYQKSGGKNFYRMTPHHHEVVKKIWESIEKNPTTYGNGFFVSVCDKYPEFTKYFSKQSCPPINVDARMTAKFSLILETIGYLILACYDKPKQLDQITGYSAMVHKDMRLELQDFLNFAYHLVDYLTMIFPVETTPECQEELKKYFSSISHDIFSKIEDFHRYEIMGLDEPAGCMSCSPCSTFTSKYIFGQTLFYWKDRKRRWENRISEWNSVKSTEPILMTSTEDDESTAYKSKTEDDELSEWTMKRVLPFDRQGLNLRTRMLTTDMDSTTYVETDGRKADETSNSDMHIVSSTQGPPFQAGNLKKPGSQTDKSYVLKHVTVKTDIKTDIFQNSDELRKKESHNSYSPRQRFRSRSTYYRTFEMTKNELSKTQGVQQILAERSPKINSEENRATTSARQRHRIRGVQLQCMKTLHDYSMTSPGIKSNFTG